MVANVANNSHLSKELAGKFLSGYSKCEILTFCLQNIWWLINNTVILQAKIIQLEKDDTD